MTDAIQELLDKSGQSINAAELLLNDAYADFAASRAYYAMFYAVEAVLLHQGESYSKHSAVISAFGKKLVKTGVFDSKFHRYLLDAFDLRNAGDYGSVHAVSDTDARNVVMHARELLDAIIEHLSRHNEDAV